MFSKNSREYSFNNNYSYLFLDLREVFDACIQVVYDYYTQQANKNKKKSKNKKECILS